MKDHSFGIVVTTLGVLLLCPDALLVRLIQGEGGSDWSIAFWRGMLTGIGLVLIYSMIEGPGAMRRFVYMDRWVVLATITMGIQALAFILSLANTTVANTLIIVATTPLFTALFSWIFLRETPPVRTWVAILLSFLGILIIVYHDLESVHMSGDLLALVTAMGLGITFVIIRHRKSVNMLPAMSMGKLLSGIAAIPLAAPLAMTDLGLGLMLFLGLILLPVSFALIAWGPRYIPAPEVSLLMLLETVLSPILVWLALGEAASVQTIIGGLIVLFALIGNSVLSLISNARHVHQVAPKPAPIHIRENRAPTLTKADSVPEDRC
ncbi:MAG: DMT family transporter [Arenicellales bacterium]|nr:DMT family transporter [Arenicellales bacterium]